jgi:hypothetical protein
LILQLKIVSNFSLFGNGSIRKKKRLFVRRSSNYGRLDMLRLISLLLGFSVLSLAAHASLPMDQAAERGDVAALRTQLNAGVEINRRYDIGRSALMIAARYGQLAAVETLAQSGADLNFQDNNGDTALHLAAAHSHQPVVDFLLKQGVNTQLRNRSGLNVLDHVARLANTSDVAQRGDPSLKPMAAYLAKTIPSLPQSRANTTGYGSTAPVGAIVGEPALFVDYVMVDVEKFHATPAALLRAAKVAFLQRGWTLVRSDPQKVIGSYTKNDMEYRAEIFMIPNQAVRIAFLNGYHDTRPNYLRNLEKDMLLELQLQATRQ